jgi:hypothetical protein|tara:strand:+ start:531 stop:1079 length:549 start_codon:yes stop_codon:yes gene_type:complete
MRKTNITDKQTISTLLAIVKNNYGFDISEITSSSRLQLHVVCRQVLSNIARIEKNIHPQIIAACLNKDRTSILSYFNKHDSYYNNWSTYRNTFDKIYEDYCRLKQKRKVFQNEQDLRSYLFNSGVKYSDKPSVFIKVEMKDFQVIVNTDYRNFSFNQELIRLALIDYDCKIEIIFEDETLVK